MHLKKDFYFALIIPIFSIFFSANLFGQSDTLKTYSLQEVQIEAKSRINSNLSTSPQQIISKDQFEKVSAFQVSDALKFFSGVQIKDYGGIGGLKTVSIRNMGANYTTILYDGIPVVNYLTGQIDLGRYSLENVEMLKLNIGECDDIFQSARSLALGGSLNIVTLSPNMNSKKRSEIKASIKAGSYGLFNSALIYKAALNPNFAINASAEYLTSDGDYPYQQTYGNGSSTDYKVKKKRAFSGIDSWKFETNLFGRFNNGAQLSIKANYFDSNREIPGPSRYHVDPTKTPNEREEVYERIFFTQANYKQRINYKWDFQANAKLDITHTDYSNFSSSFVSTGVKKNIYDQEEYYGNAIFRYTLSEYFSFSWANDGIYGKFSEDKSYERKQWLSALSGKFQNSRLTVSSSILNTYTTNSDKSDKSDKSSNHLSPYLGVSYRLFKDRALRIRAFYKNSYRLPTFADMYYPDVPNPNLKAENTHQYNIGITTVRSSGILFPYLSFSIDTYLNKTKDKIVVVPRQSQYKLSVYNMGSVDIKGIDFNLEFHINVSTTVTAEFSGSYTYQHAKEKIEEEERVLPYTPKHSGSGYITIKTKHFNVNYNCIYSGKRYYNQIEESAFAMKSYSDHSLSLIKPFRWKNITGDLSVECLNVFNQQYDIVRSYPMPGRSFRFGLKFIY